MGMNMMELCKSAELPVEGTCGGMAMCASCHMYVQSDHAIPDKSDDEEDMLDEAFHVTDESRLGCQIHLADDLDGLVVKLAPVGYGPSPRCLGSPSASNGQRPRTNERHQAP